MAALMRKFAAVGNLAVPPRFGGVRSSVQVVRDVSDQDYRGG